MTKQKPDDMVITSMRVTKRTTRTLEYLKGLLKFRTGQDYSLDDVIWVALDGVFSEEIKYAEQQQQNDKEN